MRSVAVLLGTTAVGLLALIVFTMTQERTLAFTLGVPKGAPVAPLNPDEVVCQGPVAVPDGDAAFDRVALQLGTYRQPGAPLTLTVEPAKGGAEVARGRLAGGYPDVAPVSIPVGRVATRRPLRVCVRNDGARRVAVYGAADAASRTSTAMLDGRPLNADLALEFERERSRSVFSLIPAIGRRASLFRVSWLGAWTYVLLALLVVAGIPALLAAALRDAGASQ